MDTFDIIKFVLLLIGSYFMGNISFARILSKAKKGDITKSGSGNPGSMNMLRTYGAKMGFLTLFLDAMKAAIPALVGQLLFGFYSYYGNIAMYSAGLAVILGHNFPVCYKFKGGKGIACTIGVFAIADPIWTLIFFVIAFIALWFIDYGSLISLSIISALVIVEGLKNQGNLVVCLLLFAIFALAWILHRSNIRRLLVGKENKANLQRSIRKRFNKENRTARKEYKKQKSEIKAEYKHEVEKIKDDKEKYKQEREKYLLERRQKKLEYQNKKRKVYNYNYILNIVSTQNEDENNKDNE